jgi:hypothetical protein
MILVHESANLGNTLQDLDQPAISCKAHMGESRLSVAAASPGL